MMDGASCITKPAVKIAIEFGSSITFLRIVLSVTIPTTFSFSSTGICETILTENNALE